jgi:hypothetical protein
VQDLPVNPIRLEIDGRTFTAADPKEICRGECAGPAMVIPNREKSAAFLSDRLGRVVMTGEKQIFICDLPGMGLRPLLPYALGFVFGEGSTLGHFAGVLRHQRIPACIDRHLWEEARAALPDPATGRPAALHCGQAVVPTEAALAGYQAQLKNYQLRLHDNPLVVPVYDAAGRTVWAAKLASAQLGEKALAVNALQVEGLPAARALILTCLDGAVRNLARDPVFTALLERTFPAFGSAAGPALMVRGSLHSEDGSHAAWSGTIPSPAVTSLEALGRTVEAQVSLWKGLRTSDPRIGFSIILQERVAAPLRGILGTGRPWEFSPEGVVTELSLVRDGQEEAFLGDVEAGLRDGSVLEAARRLARKEPSIDSEGFCEAFARLVRDGLAVRKRYSVPLDIEFVVTGDLRYVFVQFRPLFR